MCDFGLVLGLAAGIAGEVGRAQTAKKNTAMIRKQAKLENAAHEREFIVESEAANKEGYEAFLEGDRARSFVVTSGAGMEGTTIGARSAEQSRQQALSISHARDRAEAARANYVMAGKHTKIAAENRVATIQPNPLTSFSNIATAGFSNYGAFR